MECIKNLIFHPDLILKVLNHNSLFFKIKQLEKKAKEENTRLWLLSSSVLKSVEDRRSCSDIKSINLFLENKAIIPFIEKDMLAFLKGGWDECLNNILLRVEDSAVLVDYHRDSLKRQITVDEFLNLRCSLSIPFIDLKAQQDRIRSEIEERFYKILYECRFVLGQEVGALEKDLSSFVGTDYCVTVSSGTDALLVSLMAHGVGRGDAVFTTPFTFIATAEVISLLGAVPVFVDIDEKTFNIDPEKLEMAVVSFMSDGSDYPMPRNFDVKKLTPKGIIAVDLFGIPADYQRINQIARKYGLFVIEDGAQSFGAEYKGKKACSLADVGCTSFFPAKPLGGYGDGGAVFLNNKFLFNEILSIRVHGQGRFRYEHLRTGINGRLDTLQAAVLIAKLKIFPEELKLREKAACYYSSNLNSPYIRVPSVPHDCRSCWAQYSILFEDKELRKRVEQGFKERKLPYNIYYPIPLHMQPAFEYLGYKKGDFPMSEKCAEHIFSLPIHPYITKPQQDQIIDTVLSSIEK